MPVYIYPYQVISPMRRPFFSLGTVKLLFALLSSTIKFKAGVVRGTSTNMLLMFYMDGPLRLEFVPSKVFMYWNANRDISWAKEELPLWVGIFWSSR